LSQRICPRCGEPFSYVKRRVVNGRTYLYAVHYLGYTKEGGKVRKITRECYLGPEDRYIHASTTHEKEGLQLKGLVDRRRLLEYLDALLGYASNGSLDPALKREVARRLEEALRLLKGSDSL